MIKKWKSLHPGQPPSISFVVNPEKRHLLCFDKQTHLRLLKGVRIHVLWPSTPHLTKILAMDVSVGGQDQIGHITVKLARVIFLLMNPTFGSVTLACTIFPDSMLVIPVCLGSVDGNMKHSLQLLSKLTRVQKGQ